MSAVATGRVLLLCIGASSAAFVTPQIFGGGGRTNLPLVGRSHHALLLASANANATDALLASRAYAPSTAPPLPLLMLIAALQSACFGTIGTALPPALRAAGMAPAAVALLLGRIGSTSALFEVMLSSSFGKLADAIGRKPILLLAPAVTVCARATVVFRPALPVLIAARLTSALMYAVAM
jgi:hypothetical protein